MNSTATSPISRRRTGTRAGAFWVLDANGTIGGTIGVIPKDAETCELRRLYLKAAYRGHGWGTKLARTVIDWSEEHGFRRIYL